jgi:hypothetical protein
MSLYTEAGESSPHPRALLLRDFMLSSHLTTSSPKRTPLPFVGASAEEVCLRTVLGPDRDEEDESALLGARNIIRAIRTIG